MMNKHALKDHLCELEMQLLKPEISTSQKELANILADQFLVQGKSFIKMKK
jgi:hypothetical protein